MTAINMKSCRFLAFTFFILLLQSESVVLHAQGKVEAIYPFPALSIKEFHNGKVPGKFPMIGKFYSVQWAAIFGVLRLMAPESFGWSPIEARMVRFV